MDHHYCYISWTSGSRCWLDCCHINPRQQDDVMKLILDDYVIALRVLFLIVAVVSAFGSVVFVIDQGWRFEATILPEITVVCIIMVGILGFWAYG